MASIKFNARLGITVGLTPYSLSDDLGNITPLTLSVSGASTLATLSASSLSVSGATSFTTIPTTAKAATDDNSTEIATTSWYFGQVAVAAPSMDGAAAIGVSGKWSRSDHVHPSDISRLAVANPSATGSFTIVGGTVATNVPVFDGSQTWNSAGTAFSAIRLTVTNTSSAPGSKVLDFSVGLNRFGVDVNAAIIQVLDIPNIARDIVGVTGSRHVREYQDLTDDGTQGLPGSIGVSTDSFAWGYTWNAKWDTTTSTYVKDRSNANDHSIMMRTSKRYQQQWWFSDGTTPGSAVAWTKKVDFDMAAGMFAFTGALGATTASFNSVTATTFTGALSGNAATATLATNLAGGNSTTLLGSIGYQSAANVTTLLAPNTSARRLFLSQTGTGTNGAVPVWSTITAADVGLANVENTALSTWAGSTSITTLGAIAAGTWNGTVIADGKIANALTGKTYNGLTLTSLTTGFSVVGGTTSKTLTVSNTLTLAGTDGSILNVGAGGTLGSAAFTTLTDYATAGHNHAGTYVPIAGGTMTGNLIVSGTGAIIAATSGDLTVYRTDGTTGIIYLNAALTKYLYNDGTNYNLPSQGLIVGGSITASGDITAFSDERLKTNVETIKNALSKVTLMRGVEFDKDGRRGVGVIAQEMNEVVPEVVHHGEEYMSVAYGNLVGVLIEAIKELKTEIDSLKASR